MSERLKAWVHYVSVNPINEDQLLLANDVAALLGEVERANPHRGSSFDEHFLKSHEDIAKQLEEARAVIEAISKMGGDWETMKALAFLEKYPDEEKE